VLITALHASVGAWATWQALVRAMNRVEITLDPSAFAVLSTPVPSPATRIETAKLDRFEPVEVRGGSAPLWRVQALTKDGAAIKLPFPPDAPDHAEFMAARLEAALASARPT
jgi:hypothetical protein